MIFGRLTSAHMQLLKDSLHSRQLAEEIDELVRDPPAHFRLASGVSSVGAVGERGNEGTTRLDRADAVEVPTDGDGCMVEGIYLAHLALSKVSIEFEFLPRDGEPYSASKLTEVCVPINLPGCVDHERYGEPHFNLVVGYEYNGESIAEYDGDLCDRGYDTQLAIFRVRDGDVELLFDRYATEDGESQDQWLVDADADIDEICNALAAL